MNEILFAVIPMGVLVALIFYLMPRTLAAVTVAALGLAILLILSGAVPNRVCR